MVNEVVDFHSESTALLQRSCSGSIIGQQQHDQQQDLLTVSLNTRLLPNSAENLSWTFFEQVSSLDNQLRSDESSGIQANGSLLMTTSMHDVNTTTVDGQHQETITRITNGYAHTANKTDDTLSQQSPDLILQHQQLHQQQQQQQQHDKYQPQQTHVTISNTATATTTTTTSFKFTSPTATFKRKKQQLQQQLNQQQVSSSSSNNNNNRNKYDNNKCHTTATAATTTTEHSQQQRPASNAEHNKSGSHCVDTPNTAATKATAAAVAFNSDNSKPQKQQQHRRHASNAMISNAAVINFDTAARATATTAAAAAAGRGVEHGAGSGNSRTQAKTRTLPTICTRASAYANDLDLLGDTKAIVAAPGNRSTPQRMGATLPGGLAGGGGGSGGGSSKASASHSFVDGIELHLGLIGWRKKCLYTLLALLMLLIITNLVLTLWILKVMEFSMEGMGPLKIVPGGVQLTGQALIMDMLRASTIRSRHGQPIAIESSRNFSINTRDTNGMLENHLFLGHDKLECLSTGFRINDTAGRNLFSVNRDEVTIGAHALRIDGEGGAIFRESIQTPHVRAEPGRELRLESPTRQLELTAAKDINLQSRAGGIELSALEDVKLSALDGSLRLESSKILMPNLRTAQPPMPGSAQSRDHLHRVFQLCACANGKLFLAAPHSICAGDDSTVCR